MVILDSSVNGFTVKWKKMNCICGQSWKTAYGNWPAVNYSITNQKARQRTDVGFLVHLYYFTSAPELQIPADQWRSQALFWSDRALQSSSSAALHPPPRESSSHGRND